MTYRENIREAVDQSGGETSPAAPEEAVGEQIARRLREQIIWPEKSVEVRREELRQEVREEARDGS